MFLALPKRHTVITKKKPRKKQEENNENPQIDQSDKNLILHDYLLYSEVGVYLKLRVRNDS